MKHIKGRILLKFNKLYTSENCRNINDGILVFIENRQ